LRNGRELKIFAGSANLSLAKEVTGYLDVPLGLSEVKQFSDGEFSVYIGESVRGSDVFIVQPLCHPVNDHLMELLIYIDALKRASAGRINAVIPYYGYARQDRKMRARDPITAKLVADLLTTAGADRIIVMDLHAGQIQGFFNIPMDHLLGIPILAKYYLEKKISNGVVVSPDLGGVTRARELGDRLQMPLAIIDKRRPKANVSEIMNVIGDIKNKNIVLIDDLIDTGGTIVNSANVLLEMGANEVYACCTHGVLSGQAIENINDSPIREVVMLNTIPLPKDKNNTKITSLSVAELFAEAIERIYGDISISTLFTQQD